MSRVSRFIRLMHTSGRQIPNPGQGGAPDMGSISPSPHGHSLPDPSTSVTAPLGDFPLTPHDPSELHRPASADSTRRFTPKGKSIPHRPARTTPVYLPSGYPEPERYPPPDSYFSGLDDKKRSPHPLWQFFHVPAASQTVLEPAAAFPSDNGSLEVLAPDDANLKSGRSWAASELREKSFADLHTLWYILLKERNVLATQREERRRLGIAAREGGDLVTKRAFRCRKSMARIKYVLNERRLGLLAAASPLNAQTTSIPFSASTSSDPFAGLDALRGTAQIPDWIHAGPESTTGTGSGEKAAVPNDDVAKEEVESRDEGFGGGEEAKEFVEDIKVVDGHVVKK